MNNLPKIITTNEYAILRIVLKNQSLELSENAECQMKSYLLHLKRRVLRFSLDAATAERKFQIVSNLFWSFDMGKGH